MYGLNLGRLGILGGRAYDPLKVRSPVFSPGAGEYGPTQSVSISSPTVGATIRYTTNGSTPTNAVGTIYTVPISVPANVTLKAIAYDGVLIDSAVVTAAYVINGTAATPSFSPVAGSYGPTQSVTITSATSGASIYYTVDGSTPDATKTLYTGAVSVAVTETVKAIAIKYGWTNSAVGSAAYTINGQVATPAFSPDAGSYGPTQNVTITSATSGASIYYTTNGTDPTTGSTAYTVPVAIASTSTLKALAVKADYVDSAIGSAAYTINGQVATPSFSPVAGSYATTQDVTISSATSGATIYYTTNGTDPTTGSTLYSGAVSVASTATLKALAVKTGYTDSAIGSAAYTIGASFSPADLFASGEQGAWYDFSDLSTMFQDRAGTTPVTADGQTVGNILDKSGIGNHATALSDAARPLYKTDGTYHWLQFDGVDESVASAVFPVSSLAGHSTVCGADVFVGGTDALIVNSDLLVTRVAQQIRKSASMSAISFNATGTPFTDTGPSLTVGRHVLRQQTTDSSVESFVDGVGNGPTVLTGALPTSNASFIVGGVGSFFSGSVSQVVNVNRPLTTQEITDTETWVNSKTGAY